MITIEEKELQDLLTYINEIPTKYGISLVQFFNVKLQQLKQQSEQSAVVEDNLEK